MSGSTSLEYEDRYLMATAESMLRAGYSHREIERALRRMSPDAPRDSGPLRVFRSLRRSLSWRISQRRSTKPVSASSQSHQEVAP